MIAAKMMTLKSWIHSFFLMVFLVFGTTACLKTRGQLREDSEDREASRPVSVQPAQEVQPQSQYVVEELKVEITRLQGRIEDLERGQKETLAQRNSSDKEELKKLDGRLAQLEQTQEEVLEKLKKFQEHAAVANPEELLDRAKVQIKKDEWDEAAQTLSSYLKQPRIKRGEEATFLRAESYYKLKQYKKAIVDYSKFPEKFAHSSRMPLALFKIGLSFEALGMRDDATGFYQELVEKYPKSPEAKKAKKKVR